MEAKIGGEQHLAMFLYVTADLAQLGGTKSEVSGEGNGLEPKLCFEFVARDVDVGWLFVFPAVEMKPVGSDSEHGGNGNHHFDKGWVCCVQADS
jgi:hypothetical protein